MRFSPDRSLKIRLSSHVTKMRRRGLKRLHRWNQRRETLKRISSPMVAFPDAGLEAKSYMTVGEFPISVPESQTASLL
jgi:hypothetical protein